MAMLNESNLLAMKAKAAKFRTHHVGTARANMKEKDSEYASDTVAEIRLKNGSAPWE